MTVYRLVQEALTNVAKHSQANEVKVVLYATDDACLTLSVSDDGRGLITPMNANQGFGLLGMRERVASRGGIIEWGDARPGTYVKVTLPINS